MRKRAAALGIVAGLTAGGAAAMAFTPTISGAQSTTTTAPSTSSSTPDERPDRSAWMTEALAPLVTNGTITQAQADAVVAALPAAAPDHGPGGRHGMKNLDAAAEAIGITTDELRTAIDGGQTIAQVAQSKGVAVQTVIHALVADAKAHLASEVAEGDLTQAEADQKLAQATERITAFVNGTAPTPPAPATTTPPTTAAA
jgi:hypothetical protein